MKGFTWDRREKPAYDPYVWVEKFAWYPRRFETSWLWLGHFEERRHEELKFTWERRHRSLGSFNVVITADD